MTGSVLTWPRPTVTLQPFSPPWWTMQSTWEWEESCALLRDVDSVCKKRKKKKKEKNPGKIQLARDPTASDDACPRPILGWPVYLPQPLAGARITEKRRRRPNHVTRFPLRALSLCLSVALSCIIYYSAAAATMYTSPSLRHVQVGSPPKFLPFNPPENSIKHATRIYWWHFPCITFDFSFRISFLPLWMTTQSCSSTQFLYGDVAMFKSCLNLHTQANKDGTKTTSGTSTGKPIHKSQERRTSKAILYSEWLSHREKEE